MVAVWKGEDAEVRLLEHIALAWCRGSNDGEHCGYVDRAGMQTTCATHRAMSDQRFLDHLLYVRRKRALWITEEYLGDLPTHDEP